MSELFKGTAIAKGFAQDKAKVEGGVWREHLESGVCARIRRGNRPEHKRALRKYYKPFANLTVVDPRDEENVKMKAGAEELVSDWGVRAPFTPTDEQPTPPRLDPVKAKDLGQVVPLPDADGGEIRPSVENILAAFQENPDFFAWISEEADTFEHYRLHSVESAAGNSSATSVGKGNGGTQQPRPSLNDELGGESESMPLSDGPS